MFHVTRRLNASLPFAYLAIGICQEPWLLPLPALLMLGFLTWRHRHILAQVGTAPIASDGFAKHVMVDDLLRLGGQTLVSPGTYFIGTMISAMLGGF
ncbi:hypothetical protein [Devosia sediminis]|uniref:Uncharacterized protein n=1 Tax=Devosia sediminis TaxID=2798801 RepID=A0A934MJ41_9HYPH|nr:hypothetical protein [Devosia sediminis]MBJ3786887.1 hypothetical protein [Devosia sediminis]